MSYKLLPNITCICATYNRHYHLERVVRCFLDQDYAGDHLLLIYNNHPLPQELASLKLLPNKRIIVINNSLDYQSGRRYESLGAIYRDALTHVPRTTDVICHWDDDDIFLTYHLSEGVKGLQRAQLKSDGLYKAYKPARSYFKDATGKMHLAGNTMEPSIFVLADHIFQYGYKPTTTDQHFAWYSPLLQSNQLFVDPKGTPSFIYTWVGDVFKTSGNSSPENFSNCRNHPGDLGDGIITPITEQEAQQFYKIS